MQYAVIKTGGKQYRVSQGDTILVDRLPEEKGKVSFNEVLLLVNESNVKVGKPFIAGEVVEGNIVEHLKGDKVRVSKYKAKVRFRRTTGFRASLTKVQIEKIGGESKSKKVEEK